MMLVKPRTVVGIAFLVSPYRRMPWRSSGVFPVAKVLQPVAGIVRIQKSVALLLIGAALTTTW